MKLLAISTDYSNNKTKKKRIKNEFTIIFKVQSLLLHQRQDKLAIINSNEVFLLELQNITHTYLNIYYNHQFQLILKNKKVKIQCTSPNWKLKHTLQSCPKIYHIKISDYLLKLNLENL